MSQCQDSEMLTCIYTTKKCVPRKGKPEIRDRGAATGTGYIIGGAPQSLEPRAGPLMTFRGDDALPSSPTVPLTLYFSFYFETISSL
uniref:Uncharacterized protein n=1 Tax=Rhinopithecus bieti TaxID=61621 RepID=A0A2K6K246_RHIBE